MRKAIFFILFLFLSSVTVASDQILQKDGVAVNGYDVVAYFEESALKGSEGFSHEWKNVTWYFATAENRDRFIKDPDQYAPQYGGYCAFAMSKGSLAPSDPLAWTVYKDKLYLNFSTQVRQLWLQDIDNNIALADKNWLAQ